jgi:hypothetical protein
VKAEPGLTVGDYLNAEPQLMAEWGGREVMRLELLMDYSGAFFHPGRAPVAAIRWTVFSDAVEAKQLDGWRAISSLLPYGKVLGLAIEHRRELQRRVGEALNVRSDSGYVEPLAFAPWTMEHLDGRRCVLWPCDADTWANLEARRPNSKMYADGTMIDFLKTYSATLFEGPACDRAPDGYWLRLEPIDSELSSILLPVAALLAITDATAQATTENIPPLIGAALRHLNALYHDLENVPIGSEGQALAAAFGLVAQWSERAAQQDK